MSKINKAIAALSVVASLGVAAAPMATFAGDAAYNSDIHTDTLNVTVLPTCAFGAVATPTVVGVQHNAASPTPEDNDANAATWMETTASDNLGMTPDISTGTEHASASSAAYSIYAGTADTNMGTTTLTVVCNQNNGYKIFVEADNLEETGGDTINIIASPSATATGYNITTTAATGATGANVTSTTKTAAVTKNAPSAVTGDAHVFQYGIGVAPGTKAATYTGDVVYTLVQQLGA